MKGGQCNDSKPRDGGRLVQWVRDVRTGGKDTAEELPPQAKNRGGSSTGQASNLLHLLLKAISHSIDSSSSCPKPESMVPDFCWTGV